MAGKQREQPKTPAEPKQSSQSQINNCQRTWQQLQKKTSENPTVNKCQPAHGINLVATDADTRSAS